MPSPGAVERLIRWSLAVAAVTATASLLADARRRINRWGATTVEWAADLPGDDLVPHSRLGYTRAISIDANPESVWPWLVQIGHDRGGLYSYDWLENLFGCDLHSATTLLPEHQQIEVGTLIRLGPEGYPVFTVALLDPPHTLVLSGTDPHPRHHTVDPDRARPEVQSTWQWVLRPESTGTRLLVRQRLSFPTLQAPMWLAIEPVGFVMEAKMLRGIKERAES